MEPAVGFEPTTDGLQNRCSTTELSWPAVQRLMNAANVQFTYDTTAVGASRKAHNHARTSADAPGSLEKRCFRVAAGECIRAECHTDYFAPYSRFGVKRCTNRLFSARNLLRASGKRSKLVTTSWKSSRPGGDFA